MTSVNTVTTTEGCVTFQDESAPTRIGALQPPVVGGEFYQPVDTAADRPLLIHSAVMGSGVSFSIKPWTLLRTNAAFKRVLGSCVGFTGTLHLRVHTVATQYVYGAIGFYLDPEQSYFGLAWDYDDQQTSWNSEYSAHIDVALNQPAELIVPHFNRVAFMSATSNGQTDQIVFKFIEHPNIADVTTGLDATVQVHIYAWVTDLQRVGISPQSGEYKADRVISSSLSVLSKSASILSRIPILSPFATPISVFLDKGAKIAAILGFGRPTDVREPAMMVGRNARLANTQGLDDAEPIGLDPKQQKQLRHNHITGHGVDQLSFAYLSTRLGLLGSVAWPTTAATDTILSQYPINPCTVSKNGNAFNITPLCLTALPFALWRGTISITFVVHCSRFHRGRLRAYWSKTSTGFTDDPTNTSPITYLDILPGATMTVTAPFAANTHFLATYLNDYTAVAADTFWANGYITLEVDQQLVAPHVDADVYIRAFISSCSDFEVSRPSSSTLPFMNTQDYDAASIPVVWSAITGYQLPAQGVVTPIVQQSGCDPNEVVVSQASWLQGESVVNARDLMKRYTLHDTQQVEVADTLAYNVLRIMRLPRAPNNTNSATFNFISWYAIAFGFTSGGVRHKLLLPDCAEVTTELSNLSRRTVRIFRAPTEDVTRSGVVTLGNVFTGATFPYFIFNVLSQVLDRKSINGQVVYPSDANVFGVVCPDTSRFVIISNRVMSGAETDTCVDFVYPISPDKADYVSVLAAAGEDFNCHVFFGVPRLYCNQRKYLQPPV